VHLSTRDQRISAVTRSAAQQKDVGKKVRLRRQRLSHEDSAVEGAVFVMCIDSAVEGAVIVVGTDCAIGAKLVGLRWCEQRVAHP
jgi:hypothetical protein